MSGNSQIIWIASEGALRILRFMVWEGRAPNDELAKKLYEELEIFYGVRLDKRTRKSDDPLPESPEYLLACKLIACDPTLFNRPSGSPDHPWNCLEWPL